MGYSNGKITAPVGLDSDVYPTLGIGPTSDGYDLGYACANTHGRINRYSYIKPIDRSDLGVVQFNDSTYTAFTKMIIYTIGNTVPSSTIAEYKSPKSVYRIADFDGYNHVEYPVKLNINILPSNILDYDTYSQTVKLDLNGSSRNLLSLLINDTVSSSIKSWRCAILIIAEKNGSRRFFLGEKGTSDSLRLGFSPNNSNIYSAFKSMDIGTWSCTIMAVAVHGSHPDSNNEAHEISSSTGYKFPIIPECFGYKTKITGVKITTPKKRFFYKVIFIDNSGRGTYIPYDIRVQMVVQDNNNKTLFNPGIKTWGDIERDSISVSGREYIYEENYTIDDGSGKLTGLKCFMTIPDYEEEPGIWETPDLSGSNYSRYIYNQGLHTTDLEWDLSSKEVNEFRVSLSYRDSSQ